jgi:hypothetical protein
MERAQKPSSGTSANVSVARKETNRRLKNKMTDCRHSSRSDKWNAMMPTLTKRRKLSDVMWIKELGRSGIVSERFP